MDEIKINSGEYKNSYNIATIARVFVPSILALMIIAVYQTVDGFFIEKYVGDLAIASVNLFCPILSFLVAIGTMFGTGANAKILVYIGKKDEKRANSIFCQTYIVSFLISIVFAVLLLVFAEPIMRFLGASNNNIEFLRPYYMVLSAATPAIIIQTILGVFVIGEGRSDLAAILILVGGVLNCVLDFVFMSIFNMGIIGAAIATAIGYTFTLVYGTVHYLRKSDAYKLKLAKIQFFDMKSICINGSSEMISDLSGGITILFMNHIIYRFSGDLGVSALSVATYFQFIIVAIFMGFSMAIGPVFSYYYGGKNVEGRKQLYKLSLFWIAVISTAIILLMAVFNRQIIGVFFTPGSVIYGITRRGFLVFLLAGLFVGYNTFASALLTAFLNGKVSAALSISRTLVILIIMLLILPEFLGEWGLWFAWPVTEAISFVISIIVVRKYRKKYEY